MSIKKFLPLVGLVFTTSIASSQQELPSFVKDSLDTYVNRALQEWKIPGVAVGIVKDGKLIFSKGYGVVELGTNEKVDDNTLFMIGSNTKAFTGTALAMLQADKKLSLDDKVQKWLPDFKLHDPWVAKETNIRDLLCHRLGFETFQGDFMYFDSDLTTAQVKDKMGKLKPMYSFRSKWGYCNSAFMITGEIVPKASGQTWAEFLTSRIFKPLGMNRTLALSKDIQAATNKSAAHTVDMGTLKKVPYGNIDNLAPAGSISSSIQDMSKWLIMQLDNGKLNGQEIMPASVINQTRLPHSILGNGGHMFNRAHFALYGLGWFLEEYEGRKIVAHTGGVNGFVTSVCLIPEEKLGIMVFTNTDANNFYEALRFEIQDAFLGLPFRNYSNVYLGYSRDDEKQKDDQLKLVRDTIGMKNPTALPLTSYTGEYEHEVYGKMNMALENGKLVMRFEHHKGLEGRMEPLGGDRFFCVYNEPLYGMKKLKFESENNKVKSITVRVADFVEFTPYEFKKIK